MSDAASAATSLLPVESSVGFDVVGYFRTSDAAPQGFQDTWAPQFVGRLNEQWSGPWVDASAQADVMLVFSRASRGQTATSPYFEIPELYVATSRELSPVVQASLGRRLESWNQLDEQWSLGIWQPRYRWDYLHPETVGLGGGYVTVDQPWFKITAWASPLFIPERGVPISTDNGTFSSDSRWFVPPPEKVDLFGKGTPVRYRLMVPELTDLVRHPGAALRARVGRKTGPWASAGYAYKPVNQLLLANSALLKLASSAEGIHGEADIYTRVVYHQLVSGEAGYVGDRASTWISLLSEHPFRDETPARWTTQEIAPALALSTQVDIRVLGTPERATRVDVGLLRVWGGNAGDRGPDAAGGNHSHFEARYPFSRAAQAGIRTQAWDRLSASSHLIYDLGHTGTIWSTEVRYRPRGNWIVGFGADLLTSAQSPEDPEETDLIGRFRANDRVHAGVTYVF